MALPASGAISLNDVNVELGLSGTATITMNDSAVRTLFGVASGAITMNNGYGKSNQFAFSITSNQTNADLRTLAINAGWNQTSALVATINGGVYISSSTTGTPALTVSGSFPGGVSLINNGTIVGMGGAGGGASAGSGSFPGNSGRPGSNGSSGGTALSVSSAITVTNNGTIAGGGGGGGGGRGGSGQYNAKSGTVYPHFGGGGGGGGRSSNASNSSGGTTYTTGNAGPYANSNATNGASGTVSSAGGGGSGGTWSSNSGGSGGAGGDWGASGSSGNNYNANFGGTPGPYSGGASGNAITGNSNITYVSTGTRLGPIS
jgi:hypothetical protein